MVNKDVYISSLLHRVSEKKQLKLFLS